MKDLYVRDMYLKNMEEETSYISTLPVVKNLQDKGKLPLRKQVTFFVGENGTGKSTLLEAIAVSYGMNAEGGSKNFCFSSQDTHSSLYEHLVVVKGFQRPRDNFFLRAESFYNVATEVDNLDVSQYYGGKSLHEQSHGESFLSLIQNRFRGNGLYLLDEPEAALSPSRQMTLLAQMDVLVKQNSQFLIATHSPILMAYPDADILVFTEDDICLTPYEETEHVILTKEFLNHPQKMMRYLLEDE